MMKLSSLLHCNSDWCFMFCKWHVNCASEYNDGLKTTVQRIHPLQNALTHSKDHANIFSENQHLALWAMRFSEHTSWLHRTVSQKFCKKVQRED